MGRVGQGAGRVGDRVSLECGVRQRNERKEPCESVEWGVGVGGGAEVIYPREQAYSLHTTVMK